MACTTPPRKKLDPNPNWDQLALQELKTLITRIEQVSAKRQATMKVREL
mgnify:CR=1 FL=1